MNELNEKNEKVLQKLLDGYIDRATREDALRKAEELNLLPALRDAIAEAAKTKKIPGVIVLRKMSDFEEKPAEFLVPNRIPKGQITILGGEGNSGKTFVIADTVAGITNGQPCLLSQEVPFPVKNGNRNVVIFNAEDDVSSIMKTRCRLAGANQDNLFTISLEMDDFKDIKFNSEKLEGVIQLYKPALMIFDPLQSFVPPETNMGARNAMRACLNPLIGLGQKYGVSFIIAMHVNKAAGVWGRKRLADSSDMWDIARSVLMVGRTLNGDRYISHEKSNYGEQCETILFNVNDPGVVEYAGSTSKKDRDFVTEDYREMRSAPAKDLAEEMILSYLAEHEGEKVEIKKMEEELTAAGISKSTITRARYSLKASGKIRITTTGGKDSKKWYISMTQNKKAEN